MNRIEAVYRVRASDRASARREATFVAFEQSVEMTPGLLPAAFEHRWAGRVESVEAEGPARAGAARRARSFRVAISFPPDLVGGSVAQLWNVLYGNVSMYPSVRLLDVRFPARPLAGLPGPRFGIDGLRRMLGVVGRPLLCAALKPVGATPRALARLARDFALGGIDVIKDDHGLADQRPAPFRERVLRCQEAVEAANRRTGRRAAYAPHLLGGPPTEHLAELARQAGCRLVMVSPFLAGLDAIERVARSAGAADLAVLAHPALSGGLLAAGRAPRGIERELLWGDLLRRAGADAVVYPNPGGRFPGGWPETARLVERLRRPQPRLRPSLPVPGGGIRIESVPAWRRRYGNDVMFLVGSDLRRDGDPRAAASRLRALVEEG